jgi:hypothetical protein
VQVRLHLLQAVDVQLFLGGFRHAGRQVRQRHDQEALQERSATQRRERRAIGAAQHDARNGLGLLGASQAKVDARSFEHHDAVLAELDAPSARQHVRAVDDDGAGVDGVPCFENARRLVGAEEREGYAAAQRHELATRAAEPLRGEREVDVAERAGTGSTGTTHFTDRVTARRGELSHGQHVAAPHHRDFQ